MPLAIELPLETLLQEASPAISMDLKERARLLRVEVQRTQLLRLAMKGLPASKAAEFIGISAATARSHYLDPDFRRSCLSKVEAAFADIDDAFIHKRKSLHEMIEEQALSSFKDLCGMLCDADLMPSLRVKINQDFLNRCEESSPQANINVSGHRFTPEELQRAAAVAREVDAKVVPIRKEKTG